LTAECEQTGIGSRLASDIGCDYEQFLVTSACLLPSTKKIKMPPVIKPETPPNVDTPGQAKEFASELESSPIATPYFWRTVV
jgi:hypothetical protein